MTLREVGWLKESWTAKQVRTAWRLAAIRSTIMNAWGSDCKPADFMPQAATKPNLAQLAMKIRMLGSIFGRIREVKPS